MEPTSTENRREPRFQIEAGATVELHNKGQIVSATTVNMSGCGVLLQFAEPVHLSVGDDVMCDFKLSKGSGDPLPRWGVGTVVRVDGERVAIDFRGGGWTPANDDASPPDEPR
jgi:hypothetical protein